MGKLSSSASDQKQHLIKGLQKDKGHQVLLLGEVKYPGANYGSPQEKLRKKPQGIILLKDYMLQKN